jgi:hypothetical protein
MKLRNLLDQLQGFANLYGDHIQVFVVDDEGEWPFGVTAPVEALGDPRQRVVYIDMTMTTEQDDNEQSSTSPGCHTNPVVQSPSEGDVRRS